MSLVRGIRSTSARGKTGAPVGVTFAALSLLLAGLFALSVMLGSVRVPALTVLRALFTGETGDAPFTEIVLLFRLPRALTALLAGAALAVSGLQMQTLFRNPLAGPFILGISSGASLAVAVVVVLAGSAGAAVSGLSSMPAGMGTTGAAFAGAALTLFLVLGLAGRVESASGLLILGLLLGYAVSALVSVLLHFSAAQQTQAYVAWTFGTFSDVTWQEMRLFAPLVGAGILTAFLLSKPLSALAMGEAYAQTVGVRLRRVRYVLIVSTALLAGSVTAYCGPIAFIGVAVPHLARGIVSGTNQRRLFPATLLLGGSVALAAEIAAALPGSQVRLPVNAVTALLGTPVIAWVILRKRTTGPMRRM